MCLLISIHRRWGKYPIFRQNFPKRQKLIVLIRCSLIQFTVFFLKSAIMLYFNSSVHSNDACELKMWCLNKDESIKYFSGCRSSSRLLPSAHKLHHVFINLQDKLFADHRKSWNCSKCLALFRWCKIQK